MWGWKLTSFGGGFLPPPSWVIQSGPESGSCAPPCGSVPQPPVITGANHVKLWICCINAISCLAMGSLTRTVGTVEGEVGEEGSVIGRAQEINRRRGEDVAAIALILLRLAVVLQDGVEVAATTGRVGRLADAAALDDEGLLETLVNRPQRCVVTQVPLAEDPGAITSGGQHLGESYFVRVHQGPSEVGVHDPRAEVVPAGQEAGASASRRVRRKTT